MAVAQSFFVRFQQVIYHFECILMENVKIIYISKQIFFILKICSFRLSLPAQVTNIHFWVNYPSNSPGIMPLNLKGAESNTVYVQCLQSGRVLYIRNVPPFKGSDSLILKIAEPFGKIKRYFLHRLRNEVM